MTPNRDEAHATKLNLVAEAEQIASSTEWKATSARQRELMDAWKKAGYAGPDTDDELWERFAAARQSYYDAAKQHFDALDRRMRANASAKENLISNANHLRLGGHSDLQGDKERYRSLMSDWKSLGHAGDQEARLWERFKAAGDAIHDAAQAHWREQQWDYVKKVELRINGHEKVIADMESLRRDLYGRRHSVQPGSRELELIEHYDQRIREVEEIISERRTWLDADVAKLGDAKSRL